MLRRDNEPDYRQSIEEISWFLTHYTGETLSVKDIADTLDIDQSIVHNSLITIRQVQDISPKINLDLPDIEPTTQQEHVKELYSDTSTKLLTYIFHNAIITGDAPNSPLVIENHDVLHTTEEHVWEKLEQDEMVRMNDDTVELTPKAIGFIGPRQGRVGAGLTPEY